MQELDNEIKYLLFKTSLKRCLAYNSRRIAFRKGEMHETAKFALLRKFGYTITSARTPISGDSILLLITPSVDGIDVAVDRVIEQEKATKPADG